MSNTNQNHGNPLEQQGSQEQIASADVATNSFAGGFQAIATAYGDYTKKSFEDTRSFVEKLSGAKSFDTSHLRIRASMILGTNSCGVPSRRS